MMMKTRTEIDPKDTWDIEALYPSLNAWEKDFSSFFDPKKTPRWPAIHTFKGKLGDSPETLKKALKELFITQQKLDKLYVYSHLRNDEDTTKDDTKTAYAKASAAAHELHQEISWFEPELLSLPEKTLKECLEAEELQEYRFYLDSLIRLKPHRLDTASESLLAQTSQPLQTTNRAFSALNDADLSFPDVIDSAGKPHPLSHGQYSVLMRDRDRDLRKKTQETYLAQFESFENTFAELLQGKVHTHIFNAKVRGYKSALDAALFPYKIDTKVYRNLIETVHKGLPSHHRYMKLRKKCLRLDELHLYDQTVPLTEELDIIMPYDEAEKAVIESVAPLGGEYQKQLDHGLQNDRWVDRYENENKRSGGYSSGCYDSHPYILLNYKGILRDVFTLAHEAGHSMHTHLSHKHQAYHDSHYSIFVAEVASTFNEELLVRHLLAKLKSPEEKKFLLNQKLDDIRATLFRQTMFAEFELWIHEQTEKHIPLTPTLLKEKYYELCKLYFGPDVIIDAPIAIEWARIPHFYYNFYVYQYATGISAAIDLSEKVLNGGEKEREAYLNFLKGGGSDYPLNLLRGAGVDMLSPEPVEAAIRRFDELLGQLEALC